MKYSEQPLQTFRLRNFKAVRDSGIVKFTPLTVFIGNNGSGKSSLIEGLETFQSIISDGLDEAMNRWRGFEFIWNSITTDPKEMTDDLLFRHPIRMDLTFDNNVLSTSFARLPQSQDLIIVGEQCKRYVGDYKIGLNSRVKKKLFDHLVRDWEGYVQSIHDGRESSTGQVIPFDRSLFESFYSEEINDWQFLQLDPKIMCEPRPSKTKTGSRWAVRLRPDGANIADFLNDILIRDREVFTGIIDTLRYVLPYAKDVQAPLTSELGRQRYLQLLEDELKVPGWLLSTGTLRVLALLAVLRHPNPPSLVCIEEIENGLDPRTLNLIVEEIARATQSGRTQVVCTTHSPYFLDLVPLSSIVVVERDDSGQPTFTRPDEKALGEFSNKCATCQLYTMSQLTRS